MPCLFPILSNGTLNYGPPLPKGRGTIEDGGGIQFVYPLATLRAALSPLGEGRFNIIQYLFFG